MKYIKLNNTQGKKISGKEDEFNANNPRFILENFYIVILNDLLPIAKRYVNKLIKENKSKIIDMSERLDPDVIKLETVFNETIEEADIRKRITKWDYTKIEIKEEL